MKKSASTLVSDYNRRFKPKQLFAVTLNTDNIGIFAGVNKSDVREKALRSYSKEELKENGLRIKSIRVASAEDIAWVRSCGGNIPGA
jgi:hypothetical protein